MSDLKWKTRDELINEARYNTRRIKELNNKKVVLEDELSEINKKINNVKMRQEWCIKYITGEAQTRTST